MLEKDGCWWFSGGIEKAPEVKGDELSAEKRLIEQKKKERDEANCGEIAEKM